MDCIDWFSNIEPALHSWEKPQLVMVYILFMHFVVVPYFPFSVPGACRGILSFFSDIGHCIFCLILSVLQKVYQFHLLFSRTGFWFHWLSPRFHCSYLVNFVDPPPLSLLSSACFPGGGWVLFCSYFSSVLSWELRSLIWDISYFLIWAFEVVRFFLSTALAAPHIFWYVIYFNFDLLKAFSNCPWPMNYLLACFSPTCWEIFLLSFCSWSLLYFYYGQHVSFLFLCNKSPYTQCLKE